MENIIDEKLDSNTIKEMKEEIKDLAEGLENVVKPKAKKKANFLLMFLVLFFLLSTAAAAYFGYNFMMLQKELGDKEVVEDKKIAKTEETSKGNLAKETKMKDEVEALQEDIEINEIDEIWNEYTNRNLGFRLRYPKQASYYFGDCEMREGSYRPLAADVETNIIETDDSAYIHFAYRKDLLEPETVDGRTNYGDCQRFDNDLAYLLEDNQSWHIVTAEVTDENELEEFIQDMYGSGCSIGDQIPTDDDAVLEVSVESDGLPMEESQCVMNYMYEIRYAPDFDKVFAWNIGQSCNFPADESYAVCYDQEMIDSFEVILE